MFSFETLALKENENGELQFDMLLLTLDIFGTYVSSGEQSTLHPLLFKLSL